MAIVLDNQLKEHIPHKITEFPITYYQDELVDLPHWTGPFHWHPDFEIATAKQNILDYQIGQQHITLDPGDSIFINRNMMHRISQLSGNSPDPIPTNVFSGVVLSPEHTTIYQKYIQPIVQCDSLPFIVFRHSNSVHHEMLHLIQDTCYHLSKQTPCYEMTVQRNISHILEYIFCHLDSFPKSAATRIQIKSQIRIQKMLMYIYEHYADSITLEDIAGAAHISRSEAGRCFHTYMGCSPFDALIQYRLQIALRLLNEKKLSLQEISFAYGFNSVNYFSRKFKKTYGYSPSQSRKLGK